MLKMLPFVFLLTFLSGCATYTIRPVTPAQQAYAVSLDYDYTLVAAIRYCQRPSNDENFCMKLRETAMIGDFIQQQIVQLVRSEPVDEETLQSRILDLTAILIELETFLESKNALN